MTPGFFRLLREVRAAATEEFCAVAIQANFVTNFALKMTVSRNSWPDTFAFTEGTDHRATGGQEPLGWHRHAGIRAMSHVFRADPLWCRPMSGASSSSTSTAALSRSAFWKAQLRTWHWISSAICLVGLLLFAVTGFTLNHAASIEAQPQTETREITLSPALMKRLAGAKDGEVLPASMVDGLRAETKVAVADRVVEMRDGELYVDLPGPGVDSYLSVDMESGVASYERTYRGMLAVANDLHKGRDAGPVWGLFIDLIAVSCVIFALTGLGLLWVHSRGRRLTWPLTTLGLVLPVVLFILFVHF